MHYYPSAQCTPILLSSALLSFCPVHSYSSVQCTTILLSSALLSFCPVHYYPSVQCTPILLSSALLSFCPVHYYPSVQCTPILLSSALLSFCPVHYYPSVQCTTIQRFKAKNRSYLALLKSSISRPKEVPMRPWTTSASYGGACAIYSNQNPRWAQKPCIPLSLLTIFGSHYYTTAHYTVDVFPRNW